MPNISSNSAKAPAKLDSGRIFHFFEQLRTLLAAGITPYAALQIMIKDGGLTSMVPLMEQLLEVIGKGAPLSEAVRSTGAFPDYACELLVIGEQTGKLEHVCGALAAYYEQEDGLRSQIRSAVTYPLVMLVMILIVILVLLVKVMPIFAQVFEELGTGVSGIAKTLMDLSAALGRSYVVLIAVFAALFLAFAYFMWTGDGKKRLHAFLENFPLTKNLMQDLALTRFASGMNLTSAAGLDPYTSLDLVQHTIDNRHVSGRVDECRARLLAGDSFSEAISGVGLFNSFYSGMISVFAGTGSVDRAMDFIARHYREETERKIGRMLSAIEPTMVAVLSVIIGLILFSVILPLMGIMSNIG